MYSYSLLNSLFLAFTIDTFEDTSYNTIIDISLTTQKLLPYQTYLMLDFSKDLGFLPTTLNCQTLLTPVSNFQASFQCEYAQNKLYLWNFLSDPLSSGSTIQVQFNPSTIELNELVDVEETMRSFIAHLKILESDGGDQINHIDLVRGDVIFKKDFWLIFLGNRRMRWFNLF